MSTEDRNMLVTYDNIIQCTDYGFLEFIMKMKSRGGYENVFYTNVFKQMTKEERIHLLINRNEYDLLAMLSDGKVTIKNCIEYGLDIFQYNEDYFFNYQLSNFAMNLPLLLANKTIDKLYISVDIHNKHKVKILTELLTEYQDKVTVLSDNAKDITEYIRFKKINTVVTTDEIAFRNKEYLEGKSLMIQDIGHIYEILDTDFLEKDSKAKITKHRWEEVQNISVSFIELYKFKNLRKAFFV